MDTDFLVVSGEDSANAATYGEHHLTLVVGGDTETLRMRLSSAVERLGYRIISDDPLVAKRSGSAGYGSITGTTLDYDRTLTFRLKPTGAATTLVTFNYVGYPLNYKGPKLVITREAEAIAALASARQGSAWCPACGTESTDDSRFCRSCGSPTAAVPAELKVMELTNYIQSGRNNLAVGLIGILLAVITFALIIGLKGMTSINQAIAFTLMWGLPSLFCLGIGMKQLSRGLNSKQLKSATAPTNSNNLKAPDSPVLSTGQLSSLLSAPPASVTEGTTSLLEPVIKNKQTDA